MRYTGRIWECLENSEESGIVPISHLIKIVFSRQFDIGLEKFETKQLFVRLVTPTFFVIITVVQLHYFHKDFMQLSNPRNTTILREDDLNNDEDLDQSSLQGGAIIERSEKEDSTSSIKFDLYELGSKFFLLFFEILPSRDLISLFQTCPTTNSNISWRDGSRNYTA